MQRIEATARWEALGLLNAVAEERKAHLATLARNAYAPIAGYFGNTMVLRDAAGKILQLIRYRADHAVSCWRGDFWRDGKWLVNNGQDGSIVAHTHLAAGKAVTWCHVFAPHKRIGDRWISPETRGGHPTYPLTGGGIPVVTIDGRTVVEGTDQCPGAVFSLEEGLVPAPEVQVVPGLQAEEDKALVAHLDDVPDAAMAGYFGNTMVMRDPVGTIIHVINYHSDHTVRSWRDGHWVDGKWLVNNGQDNSTVLQTRELFNDTATWAHSFSPDKKVGDRWIAPETRGGHPTYPIEVGGIPVEMTDGTPVVAGTKYTPSLVMSLEKGLVLPV
jgi:hypothetical protein